MKLLFYLLVGVTISTSFTGTNSSEAVLHKMYSRYAGKWYHTLSFNQTTENYRHDSLIRTATWYEYIIFPDKFRIDFGDHKEGNAVIYTKDSVYSFKKGLLTRTGVNDDDLTFLLGGMYSYPFDTVKARINSLGYKLNKYHDDNWHGHPVYVIGASSRNEKSNQLWIDKDKLVLLRFIKYANETKEEGVFSNQKRFGKGWSETACDFYINDKLIQKEIYHDCIADKPIDNRIFDPYHFILAK